MGQIERREGFPFSKPLSILFSKPNSIQIQILFQIYFSRWELLEGFQYWTFANFWKFFIFQFSFSFLFFISKPFSNSFSKAFWIHFEFWIQPPIVINQMHWHVCKSKFLLLMINFNIMKNILFPIFYVHKNS